jgi:DegV family protein with EDD domain
MIAVITDSNAMLPRWLCELYAINVVPLGLALNGQGLLEDDELDVVMVLRAMRDGATLTTSAPSPGAIARVFSQAADAGAAKIVSIHVGSNYSSTVNSARLAATMVDIPVEVVDSHQASFSLGCCVWAAAEALAAGGTVVDAVQSVEATSAAMASVFTLAELPRAQAGGRFPSEFGTASEGTLVVALDAGGFHELGWSESLDIAIDFMVDYVVNSPASRLRVGVGDADDDEAGSRLAARLEGLHNVSELVRYQCGPSVAAHTGVGTFGAVLHPHPEPYRPRGVEGEVLV